MYKVACPEPEPHHKSLIQEADKRTAMSKTWRTLQKQALVQLHDHARELYLPTTSRKSPLLDRLYRVTWLGPAQQEPAPSPHPQPPPSVPIAPHCAPMTPDLTRTVQQLIDSSLQGVEKRLLQVIRPLPGLTPAADNLPCPHGTRCSTSSPPQEWPYPPSPMTDTARAMTRQTQWLKAALPPSELHSHRSQLRPHNTSSEVSS